jgi:hypothetical protein
VASVRPMAPRMGNCRDRRYKAGVSEMEAGIAGFVRIGGVPRRALTVANAGEG